MKTSLLVVCTFFSIIARANIVLPALLNNHMVLQQQTKVKLWGWANPGEKVRITTSWNNATDSVKADGNATWQLSVPTPAAGGPYTITFKGDNTIQLSDVLIGEVWVCSGQSNMEMNYYWGIPQMNEDMPTVENPNIRFFSSAKFTAPYPQQDIKGAWSQCDSNSVKRFSAVAYYFARRLNAQMGVPVALLHESWGGTPAEAWTPAEVVQQDTLLASAATRLSPTDWWPRKPGLAYNAMIAPLTDFTIAGAIWYQGESNTGTASTYHPLFTSMITAWRNKWNIDFPFYYVQLAPFSYNNKNIAALLREAQVKTLALHKTGMVVTTDIAGDTMDIHPKDKRTVGMRLANMALVKTYGQSIAGVESPLYKSHLVDNNKVIVSFSVSGNGWRDNTNPIGFYVAGSDRVFHPARAAIKGNTIIVSSADVANPVAVRYAFSNTADGNVFSKEGLPLSPFRTDDWPVDTSAIR